MLTAPVMRPETKMPLLPGWNATSKGCSAQRAEHSSPPSLDISRRRCRGCQWRRHQLGAEFSESEKIATRQIESYLYSQRRLLPLPSQC